MSEQLRPVRKKPKKRPDIKTASAKASKKRMPKWAKILLIVVMSMAILVVGLFIAYKIILSHYYNKMQIVDADHPDITMAANETLEPEVGDNDPSQSDSPSEEVAAIEDELARVMREYEEKMKASAGDSYYTMDPGTDPWIEDFTNPEDDPQGQNPIQVEVPSDNGPKPASPAQQPGGPAGGVRISVS